jgi:hypothetical protein
MAIPVVALAVFLAACGGAATLSSSKDRPAPVGAVQLNGGTNAGSTSDITNRPNAPVQRVVTGTGTAKPLTPSSNAAPTTKVPVFGTAIDRCGMSIDGSVGGNRGMPRFGPHVPKLMCEAQ